MKDKIDDLLARLFGGVETDAHVSQPAPPPMPESSDDRPEWFPQGLRLLKTFRDDQRHLFDPSLKHFPRAFRSRDPVTANRAEAERRYTARSFILDELVASGCEGTAASHLVLRGSVVMEQWFPEQSRSAHDVDWVVIPQSLGIDDQRSRKLLEHYEENLRARAAVWDEPLLLGVAWDDIWTYDRAPGKRLTVAWKLGALPAGTAQADFVFAEELPERPISLRYGTIDGRTFDVRTVTHALSLRWKLEWLNSDGYPQGKDLYDAVLLAESPRLTKDDRQRILQSVFRTRPLNQAFQVPSWSTDWQQFQEEYPHIEGGEATWLRRFADAMNREDC
ncbi:MAG: nucleotidyl transferase AbiEii/AbiGii toxin family protein [Pirellulales bacterium]